MEYLGIISPSHLYLRMIEKQSIYYYFKTHFRNTQPNTALEVNEKADIKISYNCKRTSAQETKSVKDMIKTLYNEEGIKFLLTL